MNKIILKYKLESSMFLVKNAEILRIEFQHDSLYIWCLIDREEKLSVERQFTVFETGMIISRLKSDLVYIGTAMNNDKSYILHIFEEIIN